MIEFGFKAGDIVRVSKTGTIKLMVWYADCEIVRFHRWDPETRIYLPSEMVSKVNLLEACRICDYEVWRKNEKAWPRAEKPERNRLCPKCGAVPALFSGWLRGRQVFYVKCRTCGMSGGRRGRGSAAIQDWTRKVKEFKW